MTNTRLPHSDSIQELAKFWDTHDLTDFEHELEEVTEPVFVRGGDLTIPLDEHEADEIDRMANAEGVSRVELVRSWIRNRIARRD